MKKTILASLIGLSFTTTLTHAQDVAEADDIVVTASRVSQQQNKVLADVTVIEREEIERAGQSTLVELLQTQPGVEISSQGGAGKQSSVFLRGTNSSHVVVMIDGLRVNSATLGTTSFENIPLAQIERIEILRGPASSLYGADAIGGVIQIFTKRSKGTISTSAFVGYGSYNTRQTEAGIGGSAGDTQFSLNVSSLNTDGFSAKKHGEMFDKDDDAYRNNSLSANVTHQFNQDHEIAAQFFQSNGNSEYDCYFKDFLGVIDPDGRICESKQTLRTFGISSHNQLHPVWRSTLRAGIGVDDSENLTGLDPVGNTSRSSIRTEQRQFTWQNDLTLPLGILTLAYDRLEQEVDSTTDYTVKSRDNNGWLASYLLDIDRHSAQLSLRRDNNSQYGDNTTGGLAYGYRITPQWRATASYATAFKAPTFNDLYWPDAGNPDLKPEKSHNKEIGLHYANAQHQWSITAFHNKIKDLIDWAPISPGSFTWLPSNVDNAIIRGATTSYSGNIADFLINGSLTIQSPRDEESDNLLSRRAQRHGSFSLKRKLGLLDVGVEVIASSHRFDTTDNDDSNRLAGYTIANLTADYQFNPSWKLQGRVNNVFDKDYELSQNYNTPGTNLFVGLRWQPK